MREIIESEKGERSIPPAVELFDILRVSFFFLSFCSGENGLLSELWAVIFPEEARNLVVKWVASHCHGNHDSGLMVLLS